MQKVNNISIAIDGPAGVGKGYVGKKLAGELGFVYLSSGELYRAIAYSLQNGGVKSVSKNDYPAIQAYFNGDTETVIESYLNDFEKCFELRPQNNLLQAHLNGVNVTEKLHTAKISDATKEIAKNCVVRKFITQIQHKAAQDFNLVLEGRDIGSVVLPDANFKFYLDASAEERGLRRYLQDMLGAKGDNFIKDAAARYREFSSWDVKANKTLLKKVKAQKQFLDTVNDINVRDNADKMREHSPLTVPKGAYIINTDNFTGDEVSEMLCRFVKNNKVEPCRLKSGKNVNVNENIVYNAQNCLQCAGRQK